MKRRLPSHKSGGTGLVHDTSVVFREFSLFKTWQTPDNQGSRREFTTALERHRLDIMKATTTMLARWRHQTAGQVCLLAALVLSTSTVLAQEEGAAPPEATSPAPPAPSATPVTPSAIPGGTPVVTRPMWLDGGITVVMIGIGLFVVCKNSNRT
ncbi:hypothetical protein [Planctomicrobium sp. SH527]|uniref:hypothetical protein n=1 Tax=Planctomicrobium sp. SH527 TaxID=3448123 RepID=UPI003F5C602E